MPTDLELMNSLNLRETRLLAKLSGWVSAEAPGAAAVARSFAAAMKTGGLAALAADERSRFVQEAAKSFQTIIGKHPSFADRDREAFMANLTTATRVSPYLKGMLDDGSAVFSAGMIALSGAGKLDDASFRALIQLALGLDAASTLLRLGILGYPPPGPMPKLPPEARELLKRFSTSQLMTEELLHALRGMGVGGRSSQEAAWARAAKAKSDGITGISPSTGCAGQQVTITGSGFDGTQPANTMVRFPAATGKYLDAQVISWADNNIKVLVPNGVGRGCVGFLVTRGPAPSSGAAPLGAAAQKLSDVLGGMGILVGGFAGYYGALSSVELPSPPCLMARPRGAPPNYFEGGPPTISNFTVNGGTEVEVRPWATVRLTWSVTGARSVTIVPVPATVPDGLPSIPGPPDLKHGDLMLGPVDSETDWDAKYVLTASNPCGQVTSEVTVHMRESPLYGIADVHTHLMAHVGFGGHLIAGAPWATGGIAAALPYCSGVHGAGGLLSIEQGPGHLVGGYPDFDGWPKTSSTAHQQAFVDWTKRAVDGGLRLAVCFAVNNEMLAQVFSGGQDDVAAVDLQLLAMRQMVDFVDGLSGGPGNGWVQIAETPDQARAIVAAGKLAIILGVEVDSLGGWRTEGLLDTACSGDLTVARRLIAGYLDSLFARGVRHIFPVHVTNNAFGGCAIYRKLMNDSNYFNTGQPYAVVDGSSHGVTFRLDLPAEDSIANIQPVVDELIWKIVPGGHVNQLGITKYGRILIEELMRRGMLIDIDHMSQKMTDEVFGMVQARQYPVVSGHTGIRDLNFSGSGESSITERWSHEGNKSRSMVEQIRNLGGFIAPILNQGDLKDCTSSAHIANDAPGSSKTWAQAYLYLRNIMRGRRVGIGSDVNGLAGLPGPRFGPRAGESIEHDSVRNAGSGHRRSSALQQSNGVRYSDPIREYQDSRFPAGGFQDEDRDIWEAIAIHKSGTDPGQAKHPWFRLWPTQAKIIDLAKGMNAAVAGKTRADLDKPLVDPFHVFENQLIGFLIARGESPDANDPSGVQTAFTRAQQMWSHWAAMAGTNTPLAHCVAGNRDFDINLDGMAHYGLLPDFLQDLRNVGVSQSEMSTLYRSAEDYIRTWERCIRHHLP